MTAPSPTPTLFRRRMIYWASSSRRWLGHIFLGVWTVITLFPIVWLLAMSLKTTTQQFHLPPLIVFRPTLASYLDAFGFRATSAIPAGANLRYFFLNSTIASLGGVAVALAFSIPAAYALGRRRVGLGNSFAYGMLFTRMLPPMSIVVPMFIVARSLHLIDTRYVLVLVYAAINIPFTTFLLMGFISQVPADLEEAGMLDGLSRFGAMTRILLPLIAPGVAAASVLALWTTWTDLQFALVLTSLNAKTMPVAIANLVPQYTMIWGVVAAAGFAFTLPMLAFSLYAGRHLVRGLTSGGIR